MTTARGVDSHPVYGPKRFATEADIAQRDAVIAETIAQRSARVLADSVDGCEYTSVSFNLSELVALAGGFVRSTDLDARVYDKLQRAKARLIERIGESA